LTWPADRRTIDLDHLPVHSVIKPRVPCPRRLSRAFFFAEVTRPGPRFVAIVTRSSVFERSLASFSDPDANDLDGLAARSDGLALCCCEPGVDEAGEQITCESVSEQQRYGEAALVDSKQLKRLARFQAETTFSQGWRPAGRAVGLLGHGKPTPAASDAFRYAAES
jgi:hypothetical protein